jgi:hypothetical protein
MLFQYYKDYLHFNMAQPGVGSGGVKHAAPQLFVGE